MPLDENISFDKFGNPVSWRARTAAVVPGEIIRLRFAVWDVFDEALDSTVLLDHFVERARSAVDVVVV
jgi:hypothetical protein